jgi:DAACS family dicarboxylate/amino acid:cation (Na+ or H+) symporter
VNAIRPGEGMPPETVAELRKSFGVGDKIPKPAEFTILDFVQSVFPRNPLDAAVKMEMLGIITFALLVGIGLHALEPRKAEVATLWLEAVGELMVFIIRLAMRTAPVGVFALIFSTTSQFGFELLRQLGLYVGVVLAGLAVQALLVLPTFVRALAGVGPLTFFRKARASIVTAFSTSSSNATLPTNLRVAEAEFGVPRHIAGFVLPLGATMCMSGTALFEGVTVLFLAQVMDVPLGLADQVIVVILCVLTAVGAAGVPGGSIPLLAMVLQSRGIPPESIAIILGVDRILDMCRTTVNNIGDLSATLVVAKSEGVLPADGPGLTPAGEKAISPPLDPTSG